MSCVLNGGIAIGCDESTGGVKTVYIGAFNEATAFTYDADSIIDTVTTTESFYTFKFKPQTASLTEEGTHSIENGTTFYTQNVAMNFHKMDATKRNRVLDLAYVPTHVIVETQNGDYWFVGLKNGANLTASTAATGQAYGDLNGYTVTLTALEPKMAYQLSQAAFDLLTIV